YTNGTIAEYLSYPQFLRDYGITLKLGEKKHVCIIIEEIK
ncbi:unnamed protein product, partial [marine sediment metagenome]